MSLPRAFWTTTAFKTGVADDLAEGLLAGAAHDLEADLLVGVTDDWWCFPWSMVMRLVG